jgi:predicted branched-subunit amino acid permease
VSVSGPVRADKVTRAGLLLGARLTVPLWPGIIVFAMAYGTAAVQKGLSVAEAMLASGLVFAGAAQLVALEAWTDDWTLGAILLVSVVTFTVNARIILMGASLQPWIAPIPGRIVWPSLALLTDANWVIAERYRAEGGRDAGVMIGAGLMLWVVWLTTTLPGALLGRMVQDPARYAIDLVLPVFFSAMAVPLWKGSRDTIAWTMAGIVSVATWWLVPGYLFMVTGALAGAITGAILGMRDDG